MKKFTYTGSTPAHTDITINGKATEVSFHKGEEYELPANDPYVKTLIAQSLLIPVAEKKYFFKKNN